MITDEQGKNWLLQKLYDNGWRYLAEDYCGRVWLATEKPEFNEFGSLKFVGKYSTVTCIRDILPKTNLNQYLSIAKELGIIDWSKVPVDTPVIVWDKRPEISQRRYFAKFKHGQIFTWNEGATSWSAFSKDACTSWLNGKLVEL